MPKKRTKPPAGAPTQQKLNDFSDGAQVTTNEATDNPHDPNEPRTSKVNGKVKPYKTIGLQFNRYEWFELEKAERITKRSKNSLIREGIERAIEATK
jgi:hypothetical protein